MRPRRSCVRQRTCSGVAADELWVWAARSSTTGGDPPSVSVQTWPNIWLNEGFATFAQYLWDEHKGVKSAHQSFLDDYARPDTSAFWTIKVADPQRDTMFASAVYRRGGMTLHALREKIGDDVFFRILRNWTAEHAHANATTEQFIDLAQRISGQDLSAFFQTWLYTTTKPTTW